MYYVLFLQILSLQQHVLPQVSQSVKVMSARLKLPLEQRVEWDLSEYLEIGMPDMMSEECKKKIFVNVPLNFERPIGLTFAKDGAEVVSKYFKMA